MLSESELVRLMTRLGVTPEGEAIVRQIRASEPSRRVGGNLNNVACRYPSKKMGVTIQAESHKNELAAVYLWDHDDVTHEFYDQPGKIRMRYRNKSGKQTGHLTTPDYFIIQDDFIGWVECKTEEWLLNREKENCPVFVRQHERLWASPPGEDYAKALGLGFQVRSSAQNPWTYVRNLTFLSDYWNAPLSRDYETTLENARRLFKEQNSWTLAELLASLDANAVDAVYAAIARQDLSVDLNLDLLAEPARTRVYLDSRVAGAYQILEAHRSCATPRSVGRRAISLTPNATLVWDGTPHTILTVGEGYVYLSSPSQDLVKLPMEQLDSLVRSGDIIGPPMTENHSHDIAMEIVSKAGPRDLMLATSRAHQLSDQTDAGESRKPISPRTLRFWRNLERRGEALYGDRFVGLIPRTGQRGNRNRKVDAQVIQIMQDVIAHDLMTDRAKSKTLCYGTVVAHCKDAGLVEPSEKTFRLEVARTCTKFSMSLAREGSRAAYKDQAFHHVLARSTPRHGDRPFEIAHIDHTEIDLQLVGEQFGENLGRAWLTLMLDAYSRTVLAFVLLFDPPSYRSCMLVMRECIRRHGRVPSTIVVDNGKEFGSEYFETLLARLETTKKSRPPHKSRFGSVMERFFGLSNTQLLHNLRGNNKALQKARQMSATHDPRSLAVWTLDAFIPRFASYAYETYGNLEHSTLGVSPNEAMRVGMAKTGYRTMRMIPLTADINLLCLPFVRGDTAVVVGSKGIKIGYIYYHHPLMRDPKHEGARVFARYDPFDVSRSYAFIDGEWRPCQSEYAAAFEGRSEREIRIASSELRGKHARDGTRRKINAEALARYMFGVERSEQLLLQQKKDAQVRHLFANDDLPSESDLFDGSEPEVIRPWNAPTVDGYEVLQ